MSQVCAFCSPLRCVQNPCYGLMVAAPSDSVAREVKSWHLQIRAFRRRMILLPAPLAARWLLSLLQLLRLLLMLLLQLLRLLLVLLLYLLLGRLIRLLFIQLHVLLVLLLLEFVSFLLLLRDYFILLLLVLLVPLRVARIWSAGPCQGWKVVGMDGRTGSSSVVLWTLLISSAIGWSIGPSCPFGGYSATVIKIPWPGCRCDAWLAHARRRALLRVGSGRLGMLSLSR